MRLEPEMWEALYDICQLENIKIGRLCTMVNERRRGASLTSATRVFIISYYRALSMSATSQQSDYEKRAFPTSPHLQRALNFRKEEGAPQPAETPSYY